MRTRSRRILALIGVNVGLAGCFGATEGVETGANLPGVVDGPKAPVPGTVDEVTGETLLPFAAAPLRSRLLLGWQYRASVEALLGVDAASKVTPPPDSPVNGLTAIGAAQLALSPTSVSAYESSAFAAAQAALDTPAERTALVGCTPSSATDEACLRSFLQRFGRQAYRRSLTAQELTAWVNVGKAAAEAYNDFYRGIEFAVAALLQSPNFLYQIELGEPDPADPSRLRLTGLELATRMAFFLSGAPPSESLLKAAEEGELSDVEGVRRHARQLLQSPQAKEALNRFFNELLALDELPRMSKNLTAFPMYSPELAQSMAKETRLLLEDVIWENDRDFRDVLDADYTFVDKALGSLYGVTGAPETGFARVALPPSSRRGGLLGQASFLSLMAHPLSTSPTFRGKFIREKLLCQPLPAPPNDAVTELPTSSEAKTMREKLQEHQANPSCSGCHVMMDNLGLALENFDALGRYREVDNGAAIDATSSATDLGTFTGARELGTRLKENPRTMRCFVSSLFRQGTGHVDTAGEQISLKATADAFAASGYRVKELLVEVVASDAFRYGALEAQP